MFKDLNVQVITFNCGRTLIDESAFTNALTQSFSEQQLPPDLLVLTLQEIAPLGPSFLGGSLLSPYITIIKQTVRDAASRKYPAKDAGNAYETVAADNAGMTCIVVFARTTLAKNIELLSIAKTGCGKWDMGNKGAVGARLGINDGSERSAVLTFVAAHLAPGEEQWKRRNEDWRTICETLAFPSGGATEGTKADQSHENEPLLKKNGELQQSHTMFTPPSVIFFAGDLNYRTSDVPPGTQDHEKWPLPPLMSSDGEAFTDMYQQDQLNRERHIDHTLHNLSEAPINFPPTYKYSSAAQRLAASRSDATSTNKSVSLWSTRRNPSWCDRILWSTPTSIQPEIQSYTALPVQPTSDHRPVSLICTLRKEHWHTTADSTSRASTAAPAPPFQISKDWRSRRDAARRLEIVVGTGAWLGFTGQGQVVLGSLLIGALAITWLLSQ